MRNLIGFILIIGGSIYPMVVIGNYVVWLADKAYLAVASILDLEMFRVSPPEVRILWLVISLIALLVGFYLEWHLHDGK
jgi:hypothetical protein